MYGVLLARAATEVGEVLSEGTDLLLRLNMTELEGLEGQKLKGADLAAFLAERVGLGGGEGSVQAYQKKAGG